MALPSLNTVNCDKVVIATVLVALLLFRLQALFWQQRSYYGVDLMPLHNDALRGYFAQVSRHCR